MLVFDAITNNFDYLLVNAAFPHIGRKIQAQWGHPEFNGLIHQLLRDTRGGKREGFPANVTLALSRLEKLHQREFPELTIPPSTMWDLNNYL